MSGKEPIDTLNGTTTVILHESHSARRRPTAAAGRVGVHFITHLPRILYALAALLATLGIAECWAPPCNLPEKVAPGASAEREREGFDAGIEKDDLELPILDRLRL